MRAGIVVLGVILIIVGLILAIVLYPMVGYATAEETSDELSEFSLESLTGKEVKFKGSVDEVYTDEVPYLDVVFDLIGLCVISIENLQVESIISGLWGGEETTPVIIFSSETDLSEGDEVTVEGYAFGYDIVTFIIGESGISAAAKILTMTSAPDPAEVEKVPHSSFYIGIMVLIIGFIIMFVGIAIKKKTYGAPSQHPPSAPPPSQHIPPSPPVATPIQHYTPPSPPQYPPPPPLSGPQYPCRTCNQPLTFVNQYQRWYCDNCRKYE